VRVAIRLQSARKIGFYLVARDVVLIIELHTNASRTVTLRAFRR